LLDFGPWGLHVYVGARGGETPPSNFSAPLPMYSPMYWAGHVCLGGGMGAVEEAEFGGEREASFWAGHG
jgi:hypothetical protein